MAAEDAFDKTKLNTINRMPARASYDKAAITSIAQEAKIAHLAWTDETTGLPQCVPMLAALEEVDGDLFVYFHGYPAARFIKSLNEHGTRVVATFTIIDGYVLALSHFHHSMNYRSAVLHGSILPFGVLAHEKGKEEELKSGKFKNVVEAIVPGRWDNARRPTTSEIKGTGLLRMVVETASAKTRTGGPNDDKEDLEDSNLTSVTWAGVVPVKKQVGVPEPTPACDLAAPEHIRNLV